MTKDNVVVPIHMNGRISDVSNIDRGKIVECRVQFINFGVVDTIHETYRATVIIKARWHEPSKIAFYDPEKHWNPRIYVENGQTIATVNWVEKISYNLNHLVNGTEVTETRRIEGRKL